MITLHLNTSPKYWTLHIAVTDTVNTLISPDHTVRKILITH